MNCQGARPHDPAAVHQLGQTLSGAAWPRRFETSTKEQRCSRRRDVSGLSLRADEGTRTPDPLLTMEVLYQLSYVGMFPGGRAGDGGSRIRTCVGSATRFTAAFL